AFLKTLEEPPAGVLIVLIADAASALTATIRSRCQQLSFAPLPTEAVERILVERHGRSAEDARWLAARAEGSPGLALAVEVEKLRRAERALCELLDGWRGREYREVAAAVQLLAGQGPGARSPIAGDAVAGPSGLPLLMRLLRLRLRAAAGLAPHAELTVPAETVTLEAALSAAEQAYRTSVDLQANANAALALERMWLRIGQTLGR
ncbi:MAG: hypothetical protein ACREQ9_19045, partial [Candidatus Binatia bacterium]